MTTTSHDMWLIDSRKPGPALAISFGVHGNERAPIQAGQQLLSMFSTDELWVSEGRLLIIFANPQAAAAGQRWSPGGIDLNRCFHTSVLAREPANHEERRAREIAGMLDDKEIDILVDFHCTVEPGQRFLMHHPPIDCKRHAEVVELLRAEVVLADPELHFGAVSLDEYQSTRGRVGICYETGWIGDPDNTPAAVRDEMINLLAGMGMIAGRSFRSYTGKRKLEMFAAVPCQAEGFTWHEGVGANLQALEAGTELGVYPDGRTERLDEAATLIFPKKKPELLIPGKPMVYLARQK